MDRVRDETSPQANQRLDLFITPIIRVYEQGWIPLPRFIASQMQEAGGPSRLRHLISYDHNTFSHIYCEGNPLNYPENSLVQIDRHGLPILRCLQACQFFLHFYVRQYLSFTTFSFYSLNGCQIYVLLLCSFIFIYITISYHSILSLWSLKTHQGYDVALYIYI